MIPKRLIDKAVRAAGENWVLNFEWEHDKLHAQVHAALETVAADIWEDGYDAGSDDERAHHLGVSLIDINQHTPNPYKRNETA